MKKTLEALIFEEGIFGVSGEEISFFQKPVAKRLIEWKKKGLKTAGIFSYRKEGAPAPGWRDAELLDVLITCHDPGGILGGGFSFLLRSAFEKLKTSPEKCGLIASSEKGILAGTEEGCGLVIDSGNSAEDVEVIGPVHRIREEQLFYDGKIFRYPLATEEIPAFWDRTESFRRDLYGKKPVFFFDYDGTLSPIVAHPVDAVLMASTRKYLRLLSENHPLVIISGRGLSDVKERTDLEGILYAGSHGFEIEGWAGLRFTIEDGERLEQMIREITMEMEETLVEFFGVEIESKKYAVAVHYRNVPEEDHATLKEKVCKVVDGFPALRIGLGKKVFEIRSRQKWDKGKAMLWIAEKMNLTEKDHFLIYVGDDLTDEDAFRVMPENGLNILAGKHDSFSYADVRISGTGEIDRLIRYFIEM